MSTNSTDSNKEMLVPNILWPALQKMDPQMRKLLEVTHEAWVDSGVDYRAMRGSARVGVYLGCCGSEVHAMWLSNYNDITGYEQTGCTMSMFANRLSFFFDFRGPSKAVDTGAALCCPAHALSGLGGTLAEGVVTIPDTLAQLQSPLQPGVPYVKPFSSYCCMILAPNPA